MLESYLIFAVGLSTVAILLLSAAVWMHGRVLGRISAVERELLIYRTAVEQLDTRITREVKTRAGLSRAEAAAESQDILQQSKDVLAKDSAQVVPIGRPTRPYRR